MVADYCDEMRLDKKRLNLEVYLEIGEEFFWLTA
jgi:hypothetical protein